MSKGTFTSNGKSVTLTYSGGATASRQFMLAGYGFVNTNSTRQHLIANYGAINEIG
jgi:hypothetical protein